MITIINETIAQVPSLHVVKEEYRLEREIPTIFFFHGFTSAKEHNLHVAYLLAEKGFRVYLPDALYHGERSQGETGAQRDLAFWEIILTSIHELGLMKQELEKNSTIGDRIGVIGTSMGAITMFGALTQYPWIQTAVSFMGTAYYEPFANGLLHTAEKRGLSIEDSMKEEVLRKIKPFDLSTQLDKLDGRPLFMWHGKDDQVVPYPFSKKLYEELEANYEQTPEKLQFLAEEKIGHKVSRRAILQSVDWFSQHLQTKVSS
ncbi:esterase [Alkalihalobacillus sp. MEB130]|uniref:esterase n=1 Tax=Alkalihalobacillus sp. MEB130 TaxID=2976704 RepID=UPI0028E097BB|nr:esterase [Alkalihalobacillus sp. MEB130]MDT8859594.1 esterase [Alkalihalobacillus sp. MEB130]